MATTIKINHDTVTYTPGLEVAVRQLAWEAMHAGARITWPDGTINWYTEVGAQLWFHTLYPDGKTAQRQVR